jgi:hypothetical protein
LGAGVALSAVTAAVPSATAQELEWATQAGSNSFADGRGIATDPRGNSYVTGEFFGTATFGAGEANETMLEAAGGFDVFVAKYARDGTLLWATSAGGATGDSGNGIQTDPRGNSYVTGEFSGTATFGAGEANETVLEAVITDRGNPAVFVAKYARDGTTGYHAPFARISSSPVSWLTRNATGWQSRSLQQGMPLGDRSPAYHSCDSTGSADAAVATSTTIRATDQSISLSPKCKHQDRAGAKTRSAS